MSAHEQKVEGSIFGISWSVWSRVNAELSELRKENVLLKEEIKTLKNERSSNTRTYAGGRHNEITEK
jgi:cell division protein FtsB